MNIRAEGNPFKAEIANSKGEKKELAGRKQREPHGRARTAAARRRKKSKRKYTIYYILVLVLLLVVGISLSLTVFFKVETILVDGSGRYSEDEIIKSSNINIGDNLIRLQKKGIAQELIDQYPYIMDVKISKHLPATICIGITLAEPTQTIETEESYLLLDDRGRVLEDSLLVKPEGYYRVIGIAPQKLTAGQYLPESSQEAYRTLQQITQYIALEELANIWVIDLTDPLSLRLLYDGRVSIELGSRLQLDHKIRFAKTAMNSIGENEIGMLDVSNHTMAHFRPLNLFAAENWPFPQALLEDYEREIATSPRMVPTPAQSEAPVAENATG